MNTLIDLGSLALHQEAGSPLNKMVLTLLSSGPLFLKTPPPHELEGEDGDEVSYDLDRICFFAEASKENVEIALSDLQTRGLVKVVDRSDTKVRVKLKFL